MTPASALGPADERPLQIAQARGHRVDLVADPEPQVGRDLVVAAAAGVELAADVADAVDQRPLDVHVDVFQVLAEVEPAGGDFLADLLPGR